MVIITLCSNSFQILFKYVWKFKTIHEFYKESTHLDLCRSEDLKNPNISRYFYHNNKTITERDYFWINSSFTSNVSSHIEAGM